ncbi:MAG: AraC family transcriptional regulator, partial [Cryptosporangiaceae bacterium]|nr:AraC family transcriptional regulator [Cryptosporangiaceae bacterium]
RRGATALGITDLAAHAERWRPWRSYAVLHLWQASTLEG